MKKQLLSTLIFLTVLFVTAQNTFLIPNPSFEHKSCCPGSFSQLSCADNWMQAGEATSDFMDSCNYFPAPIPEPIPDGRAIVGELFTDNWLEYVGVCLPQQLDSNVSYNLTMDIAFNFSDQLLNICNTNVIIPEVNITLFGDINCSTLPFGTTNCPIGFGNWQELGYVTVNPYDIQGTWGTYNINFTPNTNINAIMFGPPCELPLMYATDSLPEDSSHNCMPYFMFDNLRSIITPVDKTELDKLYFKIIPNPNNGKFLLNYNINKKAELSIFTLSGKQVYTETLLNNSIKKEIDLRNLHKGIYLVKIQTQNKLITKKIVIN